MDLNERKKQILKSIIDAYIDSGEPVGSKYLTQYGQISLSPATIRNEMSELEEMGFLDKPHTSAGRVPSNAAYRMYVDNLMESYRLTCEELDLLNDLMRFKRNELDSIVDRAGKIMSGLTNYASLTLTTKPKDDSFSRFDALLIDSQSFLLVMITAENVIKTRHVYTDYHLDQGSIDIIKRALNANLANIPMGSVALPIIMKTEEDMGRYRALVNPILRICYESISEETSGAVKIDGLTNLLSYPEFNDVSKVKELMKLFEEKRDYINNLLKQPADVDTTDGRQNKLRVYIGDDAAIPALSDASMVFCSIPMGTQNAVVGILGPKRMDYKKVFSSLRQFASNMEQVLTNNPQLQQGDFAEIEADGADKPPGS